MRISLRRNLSNVGTIGTIRTTLTYPSRPCSMREKEEGAHMQVSVYVDHFLMACTTPSSARGDKTAEPHRATFFQLLFA
jgi:hypothetical protein